MPRVKAAARWVFGWLFVLAGIAHFLIPDFYASIIPPELPEPLALVYLSGVAEIALGVLILAPPTTRLAAWGLIALLVAVFPANVNMALRPDRFTAFSPLLLWLRLPLQGVLIAWAWWLTRRPTADPRPMG